jgi:predicted nucleotidyltransferase
MEKRRTRSDLLKVLEEHRARLRTLGARRLGLFGSTARDEASPTSDLDFVVELDERTFDRYMDLKLFLEELFGCRVDLVLAGSIKPRLRSTILREAVYVAGL